MTRHRTNPGDAEEKRYSCHRVNCVTMDPPHHCVAPKCNCPLACHPKGYQPLLHIRAYKAYVVLQCQFCYQSKWEISAQSLIDSLMNSVSRFICAHLNVVMLENTFTYHYSHCKFLFYKSIKKEVLNNILFSFNTNLFSLNQPTNHSWTSGLCLSAVCHFLWTNLGEKIIMHVDKNKSHFLTH